MCTDCIYCLLLCTPGQNCTYMKNLCILNQFCAFLLYYSFKEIRPPPSWRSKAAGTVGQACCTHTAHGTVGGPLVGAPAAFGTTQFRRPTLPEHPLRPSASAHTAGRRTGGGPAALTRPMGRSGGPWLELRERLAPPGLDRKSVG